MYQLNFVMKNGNIFATDYLEEKEVNKVLDIMEECNWILVKFKEIILKESNNYEILLPFKNYLRVSDIERIDIFEKDNCVIEESW